MASSIIEITINWDVVKDGIRRELITGGFGQLWEDYCWQNNGASGYQVRVLRLLGGCA
jgi:hypothetical protein